jgi:hypothetical protein
MYQIDDVPGDEYFGSLVTFRGGNIESMDPALGLISNWWDVHTFYQDHEHG